MHFLLVRPPYLQPIMYGASVGPDIGLGYLIAALKRGRHKVTLLDCQGHGQSLEDFRAHVESKRYDAIGFKTFTKDFGSTKRCCAIVRQVAPATWTLAGGPHPTVLPEETLELLDHLDFAFHGEAEEGISHLADFLGGLAGDPEGAGRIRRGELLPEERDALKSIPGLVFRQDKGVTANPPSRIEDLDSVGYPAWEDLELDYHKQRPLPFTGPYIPMQTTRGCPYNCAYCSVKYIHGKRMRERSVEHVIAEMRLLKEQYGIKHIFFMDDHFMVSDRRMRELSEAMLDSGLGMQWNCLTNGVRIEAAREGTIQLMERAGCYGLTAAAESGSQRILDKMHKNTTVERIEQGAKLITSLTKIRLHAFFIIGYPGETREDIWKSIRLARRLPVSMADFFCFVPHPGTEIWDELKEKGELTVDDYDQFYYDRVTYVPEGLTRDELRRLRLWAHLYVYATPWRIWDATSRIATMSDFSGLARIVKDFLRSR